MSPRDAHIDFGRAVPFNSLLSLAGTAAGGIFLTEASIITMVTIF
jgi:hypothetical protein